MDSETVQSSLSTSIDPGARDGTQKRSCQCCGFLECPCPGGVDVDTVKAVVLDAEPADVVTLRGPVEAPEGTEV